MTPLFILGLSLDDVYIKRESEDTSYSNNPLATSHGALGNHNILGKKISIYLQLSDPALAIPIILYNNSFLPCQIRPYPLKNRVYTPYILLPSRRAFPDHHCHHEQPYHHHRSCIHPASFYPTFPSSRTSVGRPPARFGHSPSDVSRRGSGTVGDVGGRGDASDHRLRLFSNSRRSEQFGGQSKRLLGQRHTNIILIKHGCYSSITRGKKWKNIASSFVCV